MNWTRSLRVSSLKDNPFSPEVHDDAAGFHAGGGLPGYLDELGFEVFLSFAEFVLGAFQDVVDDGGVVAEGVHEFVPLGFGEAGVGELLPVHEGEAPDEAEEFDLVELQGLLAADHDEGVGGGGWFSLFSFTVFGRLFREAHPGGLALDGCHAPAQPLGEALVVGARVQLRQEVLLFFCPSGCSSLPG